MSSYLATALGDILGGRLHRLEVHLEVHKGEIDRVEALPCITYSVTDLVRDKKSDLAGL